MSNIYIQEPPTSGKVLLETSVGDIDIELWSRETPKACRNFVQLCLDGYYNGTIFHRLVKGFIVQGGDPTGTGTGGKSIYPEPFKDEFHTRLRFVRRGLVAMANTGKDDNGSQFFFTLGPCPELQNKHTIFGKVAGDTVYNMVKLEDGLVDRDERPQYPHKIYRATVLNNPFPDVRPSEIQKEEVSFAEGKEKAEVKKNFKLLSFGDEAEEDDIETNEIAQEFRGKSKSSHDLANDPSLSSVPVVDDKEKVTHGKRSLTVDSDDKSSNLEMIKKKLKKNVDEHEKNMKMEEELGKKSKKTSKKDDSNKESLLTSKHNKVKEEPSDDKAIKEDVPSKLEKKSDSKKTDKTKKSDREQKTLLLLEKFKTKLHSAKGADKTPDVDEDADATKNSDSGWLTHTLNFETNIRQAKDANVKNEDTFEIYDPRNPINQRRREASKQIMKAKRHK